MASRGRKASGDGAGAIGTVNPNRANKKKRPETEPFYIYEVQAYEPQ